MTLIYLYIVLWNYIRWKTLISNWCVSASCCIYSISMHIYIAYIGIELSDKAGEVVVFEVFGEKRDGKSLRIPHNEAVVFSAPWNYLISGNIINYVISLCEEWWRTTFMKPLKWLWSNKAFSMNLLLHNHRTIINTTHINKLINTSFHLGWSKTMSLALIFECQPLSQQGHHQCQLFSYLKNGAAFEWNSNENWMQMVAPQEKEGV